MPAVYPVGMAELRIGQEPDVLAAYGVGSCVIVIMFDPRSKKGGLAHVVLPDSAGISQERLNPRKFADTAIPLLFQTLAHAGAYRSSVWAKMVGGAEMFPLTEDHNTRIGAKNSEAVESALTKLGVPIQGKELGGSCGRSVELHLDTGKVSVTILGESSKEL